MDRILLQCPKCGHQDKRPEVDPYTGHMYDCKMNYTCHECRSDMVDVTHREGAVCYCDVTLRDLDVGQAPLMIPFKIWRHNR